MILLNALLTLTSVSYLSGVVVCKGFGIINNLAKEWADALYESQKNRIGVK